MRSMGRSPWCRSVAVRYLLVLAGVIALAWGDEKAVAECERSRDRSGGSPRFCFVRGFGGTGTGLLTMLVKSHPSVSGMEKTTAKYEDEGQYLQSVFPQIRQRTDKRCGGSIASCPKMMDDVRRNFGSYHAARERLCREWGKWWDWKKQILVEKTPDLSVGLLSALFPGRGEACVLLAVRHPYFWHHSRHCPGHDAPCLIQRWSELMRDAIKRLFFMSDDLRGIAVRYEDMVTRHTEVSDGIHAALGLSKRGRDRRRRLALRGSAASSDYLWEFSAHDGGKVYGEKVRACLADQACLNDTLALAAGLPEAFGYNISKTSDAVFSCLAFAPVAATGSENLDAMEHWVYLPEAKAKRTVQGETYERGKSGLLAVIQAYALNRAAGVVKLAYKILAFDNVRGVMVIWNNEKQLWPLALNDTRFIYMDAQPIGAARSLLANMPPVWPNNYSEVVSIGVHRKLKPLLVFAAEDRIDNHYSIPALFAGEADFRTTVIVDDDVDITSELVSCFDHISLAHPRLMLAPSRNLRAFLNPNPKEVADRNSMKGPHNPDGRFFCAGLPQFILLPFPYLRAYVQDHPNLLDFVKEQPICDDYAIFVVARHAAAQFGKPIDVLAGVTSGHAARLSHVVTPGSLAKMQGHYERRYRCWIGVAESFRRDHPELSAQHKVFTPVSRICTCQGQCRQSGGHNHSVPVDSPPDVPRVCEDVVP